jgi:hypothetical protein
MTESIASQIGDLWARRAAIVPGEALPIIVEVLSHLDDGSVRVAGAHRWRCSTTSSASMALRFSLVSGWQRRLTSQSSKPTKTVASSTDLRCETTEFAGKLSSGQPIAMQVWIT